MGMLLIGPGLYNATNAMISSNWFGFICFKADLTPELSSWNKPVVSPVESRSNIFGSFKGIVVVVFPLVLSVIAMFSWFTATNLLFFEKGNSTKKIWYYEGSNKDENFIPNSSGINKKNPNIYGSLTNSFSEFISNCVCEAESFI